MNVLCRTARLGLKPCLNLSLNLNLTHNLSLPLDLGRRAEHTDAPRGAEVDVRRLDGEDGGIVEVHMCRPQAKNALGHVFISQPEPEPDHNLSLPLDLGRRAEHTDAPRGAEVDVRRLDGEDGGIVEVHMCRPQAKNALGHVFISQMRGVVLALGADTLARVVIFRSLVPGVFCAASLPMPTIAALDGAALGAYSAQMGLIETTRGLLPGAGGSQRLPRVVGVPLAKELIFTGRRVGGQAALGLGLAPVAVRMAKEAVDRGTEVDITVGMAIERMCYARVIQPQSRPRSFTLSSLGSEYL
ncbi:hypothetical protein CRUP_027929 [Coryphaenoides rupestris]|nr:hypothetical protein CRUP_027929 [Coryphaenoides rupestris]